MKTRREWGRGYGRLGGAARRGAWTSILTGISYATAPILRSARREERIVEEMLPEFGFNRGPVGRLFLVRRAGRRNFKAGNIMNFLDQHGDAYDFLLVLDADSVMLGQSIERLILTLQEHPRIGILQTLMVPIRSATPFARAMQYSTAHCLPLYAKGMLWFYDRDSVYWGHNALIRVAPFREHCRLPTLPGKPPLGGTIMSQDIVEAALIGRAGWEVGWLIDGGGSFDELPANILTYGQRDRRWCQGNFQHYRFILAPGIRFGHRFYFANGIFSYLASPLLLLLILLGLTQACLGPIPTPDRWLLWASMGLFWFQMLAPRVLGLLHFAGHCKPSPVKGPPQSVRWLSREAASTLAELALNLLMGPLLFYLHTRFVVEILSGGHVVWRNQSRNPGERVSWASAGRVFWLPSLPRAARPRRRPPRRFPAGAFYSPGDRLLVALHSVGSAYVGCGAWFMAGQGGILPRCPDRRRAGAPWPARE